ncbi:hypothetical protein BDV10DRAFT_152615 [Aspergillus recurvatus]
MTALSLLWSWPTLSPLLRSSTNKLTDSMSLLAIELLGHGQTQTPREQWAYWDIAEMNLQVLEAMGIDKAFVLTTSQGGWIYYDDNVAAAG